VVLQKNGLVMTDASKPDANQNVYADGRITHNAIEKTKGVVGQVCKWVPGGCPKGSIDSVPATRTFYSFYTLMFDNSMLADDAAREKDRAQKVALFTRALENMKNLAEGGALPPVPPGAECRSAARHATEPWVSRWK
jgi:hypothetical protein